MRHWYLSLCMGGVWSAGQIETRSCAHHQENTSVSMRHWYLSLCMGGVWSAGQIESIQPADQTPPIHSDQYHSRMDTAIFHLMMGRWMPETCRDEK